MRVSFLPRALALAACLACSLPSQAGLFDDDEARKAILDLRTRLDETRSQNVAAQRQLNDQIQTLQRSLLDLNNQNEQLKAELARLRGQLETTQRDLADVQRRQKDMTQVVDERMKRLEPQQVTVDGKEITVEPDEKRAYEEAIAVLRSGDFEKAAGALQAFLRRWPQSGYTDSARYWLGNAQYGLRAYKDALATFRQFLTAAPEHLRAPEALLALANCQVELKDTKGARRSLDDLVKQYPKSEAAVAARERLAVLR
ncbi:tol-pal system protein YbgF [Ideonella sp. 4Y16]|uniref:tol-pal system protein YbgF n=1 Tax=Ideonella alba TaxID=2824118 RepID=UPI001B373923|nr:tol-pal system protein YbgF [Ideonella alba]MBQ0942644.1 tol-pal system protein YbgF [Ideonella alba]